MKKQKSNKKKYITLFFIFFFLPILWQVVKYVGFFAPDSTYDYESGKEIVIKKSFGNNGCYEFGFWSSDGDLHYRMHDGKYEIAYYHDDKLIKKKILTKNNQSGYSMKGGYGSHIAIDTIELPLDGKYRNLTIHFKAIKEDSVVAKNGDIKFYIDKSILTCGKEKSFYQNSKNYPITKNETNETLKPLFLALVKKDTNRVKSIIEDGIDVDVNVKMIGDRRPIFYSAFVNDDKTLKYLIDKGAKINIKDIRDYSPLHYAIENNATKTAEMLLENGADLNMVKYVTYRYMHKEYYRTHPTQTARPIELHGFLIANNLVKLSDILFKYGLDVDCKTLNHLQLVMKTYNSDYKYYKRMKTIKKYIDKNNTEIMSILKKLGLTASIEEIKYSKLSIKRDPLTYDRKFTDKNYTKIISILKKYGKQDCLKQQEQNRSTKKETK